MADTERLYWSTSQIQDYRLVRLRETLERARRTPFYSSRLAERTITSLDDLAVLPLTTKEQVRDASPFGLVAVPSEQLFQYHETFGTTGKPASSWMTRADFQNFATQINHAAVDFHSGDRVVVRFPYAISVPAHIVTQAARDRGACVIPAGARTPVSPYPRVLQLMDKLQATVLCCLPMEAIWLAKTAQVMERDARRDFPTLRALCVAGELLSPVRQQRLSALWGGRPVYNLYGCTEAGNLAADCPEHRLHLSWDHFLLEVLDPDERGLGTAVVTTLTREAMPLLRYVLGDTVRLVTEHGCRCGRKAPILEHYGREVNQFSFEGRGPFYVRDLEERLLRSPESAIGDLWLIEIRPGRVVFRAEAQKPDTKRYRDLEAQVGEELGLPLHIEAEPPGALLSRTRLLEVKPVGKSRTIAQVPDENARPLTLDDLM